MKTSFTRMFLRLVSLCVLLAFAGGPSSAQLYKVELDEKVENAPLIFEGKVIERKSFWNESHSMIFTSNTVEIYKIFKGAVSEKIIEVLTQGGSVGLEYIEASDLLQLDKSSTGIFFCEPNRINLRSPYTGKILFDVYSSDQGFLRYNLKRDIAYAPFAAYEKIEGNLYKLLEQKTGQQPEIINNSFNISSAILQNQTSNNQSLLAGSITSFSPATVHGGTLTDGINNILTINGSGFGAVPSGSCAVLFTDGSPVSGTTFPVKYNSFYVVSWSDTKIIIKVPSRAATGNISVVTSTGSVIQSVSSLNVFYSVLNAAFANLAGYDTVYAEPRMMNTNGLGGYSFLYSTNTAGGGKNFSIAPEKETYLRAINTWKEQVGLNFIEGGNTTIQQVRLSDKTNVVMFDNTNTGNPPLQSGVLATTYNKFIGCIIGTQVYAAQKSEFDIVIRNPGVSVGTTGFTVGPCFPLTNDIDLETVLLHELGHALNLAHINDTYQGTGIPNYNPTKLMHYAVLNYVDRRSPDNSAYTGALYAVKKLNAGYGPCSGLFTSEMTVLSNIVIPNDECPAIFPTTATPAGTLVNFDLVHATSNKTKDPQYTAVNCAGTGTQVTNNAYYAFKTGSTSGSSLSISITGYATTPSTQAACTDDGVRLAVYDVSSCPAGQAFPQPVSGSCKTFSTDAVLSITGLLANHSYLLYFDGLRNTKAKFNATLNGSALPLTLSKFSGEYINGANRLYINILQALNVKRITIEKSNDAVHFNEAGTITFTAETLLGTHNYADVKPFAGNNYYRLAIISNDGTIEYSNIILLKNEAKRLVYLYPNPVKDVLTVNITATLAARFNFLLYDVSGRLLFSKLYDVAEGSQNIQLPLSKLSSGAYTFKLTDQDGNTVTRQNIIKQ
ncbi:MAG TPA: T9SS type A sorting domain-containing protein [Panacibacter sp.]|nr:T9SS type A sorting domain-containing protein [Panacibacter sp.]